MPKCVKLTINNYKAAKILLRGGASNEEVEEFLGISHETVRRIKISENYEDYLQRAAELRAYYAKKNKNAKQKAVEEAVSKLPAGSVQKLSELKQEQPPADQPQVQIVEHRQSVTIQATHYMMEEMKKTNELLKCISAKLAFIVDELTGVPKGGNRDEQAV